MKIRIKGNSVRFRLTKSEVETLALNEEIFETTNFGKTKFSYGVVLNTSIDDLQIKYHENFMILEVPYKKGKSWHTNAIIGFNHVQKTASADEIMLLLEKDFTCLDNTLEDQSDNYPNPKLNS